MPTQDSSAKDKKCFIISSIGDPESDERIHLEWFIEYIIVPVFIDFPRYEIVSSLNIHMPGMIDSQIVNHLLNDDVVIADMTFLNANVFYEIGVRHLAQKPIIHTFRQNGNFKIPFDVQSYRAIEYSLNRPSAINIARNNLSQQLRHIEQPGFHVDNPITRAIGEVQLRSDATPAERLLLERIEAIELRQSRFEIDIEPHPRATIQLKHPLPTLTATIALNDEEEEVDFRTYEAVSDVFSEFCGSAFTISHKRNEIVVYINVKINIESRKNIIAQLSNVPRIVRVDFERF